MYLADGAYYYNAAANTDDPDDTDWVRETGAAASVSLLVVLSPL